MLFDMLSLLKINGNVIAVGLTILIKTHSATFHNFLECSSEGS